MHFECRKLLRVVCFYCSMLECSDVSHLTCEMTKNNGHSGYYHMTCEPAGEPHLPENDGLGTL